MRLLLTLLLAPSCVFGAEVAVSTPTASPLREAVDKLGETIEKGVDAVQEGVRALGEGAKTVGAGAKAVGEEAVKRTKELTRNLRRFAVELGTGEDSDLRHVTDPFLPKGLDRLFAWDVGLNIRNSGVGLRGKFFDPPHLKRLTLDYRLYFDPFARAGLGDPRDHLYDGFGLTPPVEKRGYGLGLSAVRDAHWGYAADYDRKRFSEAGVESQDQMSVFSVGYAPLGENNGLAWNWAWITGVHWQDIETAGAGLDASRHGPGFSFGPAYQLALDWVRLPLAAGAGPRREFKLNRLQARLSYADSQIHPSSFGLGLDVSAYLTRALRLTVGVSETYLPRQGEWQTRPQVAASLILNFRNFKF